MGGTGFAGTSGLMFAAALILNQNPFIETATMLKLINSGGDRKVLKKNEPPYVAHVFVCTNDRGGARKSCADNNSALVKARLKEAVNENGWKGKVRISTSGCMGLCAQGSNVMIYPQKIWFSEVTPGDVDQIVSTIENELV